MPRNTNPWVVELLSWHGHDRGGVRVPFQANMGKPLGAVITTPLIAKVRRLAQDLATGRDNTPRWIFLVGGPGNGKSEAVEAFVQQLDDSVAAQGTLVGLVEAKFRPSPITPRRVTVDAHELATGAGEYPQRVNKLILIQDASAVDQPTNSAEETLVEDLGDLLTSPPGKEPVFVCCANRGLLARALSAIQSNITHQWLNIPEVTGLLSQVLTATGLGLGALRSDRPRCWPLEYDSRFAAWPLDLETIVGGRDSAMRQMLIKAVDTGQWEQEGRCADCDSNRVCPFYINAKTLRQGDALEKLLVLLRHGELATGQRWNFRDAFSLCAELLVGERGDFGEASDSRPPCSWVHERVEELMPTTDPDLRMKAGWGLTLHLYQQAIFPCWPEIDEDIDLRLVARAPLTRMAIQLVSQRSREEETQVRVLLGAQFSRKVDPANASPGVTESLLHSVEDEFGQSIRQGLDKFGGSLTGAEVELLELVAEAEKEWDGVIRDYVKVHRVLEALRAVASVVVKRSLGVVKGEYLNLDHLIEYEAVLGDQSRLAELVQPLRKVVAPDSGHVFSGSLVRVFGQPLLEKSGDVVVSHSLGPVLPKASPRPSEDRPGHDLPWAEVEGERIPLTFDLFVALRLSSAGCESASFAPQTRAAIDKVRNAIAARLSRDRQGMVGGTVLVNIDDLGQLSPSGTSDLRFQMGGHHDGHSRV